MPRLLIGTIVKTSYGTGPYVITKIIRDCTCEGYIDFLNMGKDAPKSKPHVHLECEEPQSKNHSKFYLNGYDENTLHSVWNKDYLIVCAEDTLLLALCCL